MLTLPPYFSVHIELFCDHRVYIDVLGNMVVVLGGVLNRRGTVGRHPDGRVRLLVGLGHGQRLIKLPVFSLVGDFLFGPRFNDDLQGFFRHLPPLGKGDVPTDKLMFADPDAGAELQPSIGQMVQHRRLLSQTQWVVKGQLVNHYPKPESAGALGQRA